ncbi:hypothetical protein ACHAWF_007588, partial [Thalassiosira exigua]
PHVQDAFIGVPHQEALRHVKLKWCGVDFRPLWCCQTALSYTTLVMNAS